MKIVMVTVVQVTTTVNEGTVTRRAGGFRYHNESSFTCNSNLSACRPAGAVQSTDNGNRLPDRRYSAPQHTTGLTPPKGIRCKLVVCVYIYTSNTITAPL